MKDIAACERMKPAAHAPASSDLFSFTEHDLAKNQKVSDFLHANVQKTRNYGILCTVR